MEHAVLTISRTSDQDLKIRHIEVLLDGRYAASLKFGDSVELEIQPGHHRVLATNRLKSQAVEFDALPGDRIDLETVGIALGGLWFFMTMLGTVAYRVTLSKV